MMHRVIGAIVKIPLKALALAGVAVLAVAGFVAWLATVVIVDSRHMTVLCGTTMSDAGIAQTTSALVVAGALALAGLGMIAMAWKLRPRRGANKTAA